MVLGALKGRSADFCGNSACTYAKCWQSRRCCINTFALQGTAEKLTPPHGPHLYHSSVRSTLSKDTLVTSKEDECTATAHGIQLLTFFPAALRNAYVVPLHAELMIHVLRPWSGPSAITQHKNRTKTARTAMSTGRHGCITSTSRQQASMIALVNHVGSYC